MHSVPFLGSGSTLFAFKISIQNRTKLNEHNRQHLRVQDRLHGMQRNILYTFVHIENNPKMFTIYVYLIFHSTTMSYTDTVHILHALLLRHLRVARDI